jgi:hypothetical protein
VGPDKIFSAISPPPSAHRYSAYTFPVLWLVFWIYSTSLDVSESGEQSPFVLATLTPPPVTIFPWLSYRSDWMNWILAH